MARPLPRALALTGVVGVLLVGAAAPAAAHPLGGFSVNTYSAVVAEPQAVRVDVVIDRAEIPTRQQFPALDDRTGTLPGGTADPASRRCADVATAAELQVGGRPVALSVTASRLEFPPGSAGLRISRLVCSLRSAAVDTVAAGTVRYALPRISPATGWRETTAVGDGVGLTGSDVPTEDLADGLTNYPQDRLTSPPDVLTASFSVVRGTGLVTGRGGVDGAAGKGVLRGSDRWTTAFTGLVTRQELTVAFGLLAMAAAAALGVLHAFAPGHGKTVMAAVLVGRRGSLRDAALLGTSVTVTHTAGVLALGAVLSAVGLAAPDRLYPVLGLASGLLITGVGAVLLRSARARRRSLTRAPEPVRELMTVGAPASQHDHDHPHGRADDHEHPYGRAHDHEHPHGGAHDRDHPHGGAHDHDHPHGGSDGGEHSHGPFRHTHALADPAQGWRSLLVVGLAGGLVPSPSALIVLLGGIALGRAWFGTLLVVAYGVGMSVALMGTALLLVRARQRIERLASGGARLRRLVAVGSALPVATACLVLLAGAVVTTRAALQL